MAHIADTTCAKPAGALGYGDSMSASWFGISTGTPVGMVPGAKVDLQSGGGYCGEFDGLLHGGILTRGHVVATEVVGEKCERLSRE